MLQFNAPFWIPTQVVSIGPAPDHLMVTREEPLPNESFRAHFTYKHSKVRNYNLY